MKINIVEGYPVTWSIETNKRLSATERIGSYSCFLKLNDKDAEKVVPELLSDAIICAKIIGELGYGLLVAKMCLDSDAVASNMVCRDVPGLGSFTIGEQPVIARDLLYQLAKKG